MNWRVAVAVDHPGLPLVIEACEYEHLHAVLAYEFERITTRAARRRRRRRARRGRLGVSRGRHRAARDPAAAAARRASGRWPASATTSPRSVAGAAGVGRGASLPQLGVRVGGARPRAAPGRPFAARRARAGAAAGALRPARSASARSLRSSRCSGGSRAPPVAALQARRGGDVGAGARRRARRRARSTRSTSRASTASRSRIRRHWVRCTIACSPLPGRLPGGPRLARDRATTRRSPRARVVRLADPQRRGHRRDAAGRAW